MNEMWTMIILSSLAISLTVGTLMQYAHGITEEQRQANREKYARLIEEDIKKQDNDTTGCVDHNYCGTPSPEFATTPSTSARLAELESQVINDANYRDELINYVNAHGLRDDMQQSGLFPEFLKTFELEKLVKAHMTECLSTSTPTSGFC